MDPQVKPATLSKVLAAVGTAFVWFPVAATLFMSMIGSTMSGMFHLDYLMPAELFPAAIGGGALLLWAALRAHAWRKLIGWGWTVMVGLLFGSQALAVANGSMTGNPDPPAWVVLVIMASLAGYTAALIATGVGGVLLLRDLFRKRRQPEPGRPGTPPAGAESLRQ